MFRRKKSVGTCNRQRSSNAREERMLCCTARSHVTRKTNRARQLRIARLREQLAHLNRARCRLRRARRLRGIVVSLPLELLARFAGTRSLSPSSSVLSPCKSRCRRSWSRQFSFNGVQTTRKRRGSHGGIFLNFSFICAPFSPISTRTTIFDPTSVVRRLKFFFVDYIFLRAIRNDSCDNPERPTGGPKFQKYFQLKNRFVC